MKLKKCPEHGYTLQEVCQICKKETVSAHYKYVKVKGVKTESSDASTSA